MTLSQSTLIVLLGVLALGIVNATSKITVVNKCAFTIWPATLGNPSTNPTGFVLNAGQSKDITIPDGWNGARIWARTGCTGTSGSNFNCQTGNCGNNIQCKLSGATPASLAEFKMGATDGLDYYDASYVDGSNIPVVITPVAGTFTNRNAGHYDCKVAGKCSKDLKSAVPDEMKFKVGGQTVGTFSACTALKTDRFCCRKPYDTPQTCKVSSFPAKYYADLKKVCPDSYIFAFDDQKSTFTCKPAAGRKSADYIVTFCQVGL